MDEPPPREEAAPHGSLDTEGDSVCAGGETPVRRAGCIVAVPLFLAAVLPLLLAVAALGGTTTLPPSTRDVEVWRAAGGALARPAQPSGILDDLSTAAANTAHAAAPTNPVLLGWDGRMFGGALSDREYKPLATMSVRLLPGGVPQELLNSSWASQLLASLQDVVGMEGAPSAQAWMASRAVSLALHGLCGILVSALVLALSGYPSRNSGEAHHPVDIVAAAASGCAFVLHPTTLEAVLALSGRGNLIGTVGSLMGLASYTVADRYAAKEGWAKQPAAVESAPPRRKSVPRGSRGRAARRAVTTAVAKPTATRFNWGVLWVYLLPVSSSTDFAVACIFFIAFHSDAGAATAGLCAAATLTMVTVSRRTFNVLRQRGDAPAATPALPTGFVAGRVLLFALIVAGYLVARVRVAAAIAEMESLEVSSAFLAPSQLIERALNPLVTLPPDMRRRALAAHIGDRLRLLLPFAQLSTLHSADCLPTRVHNWDPRLCLPICALVATVALLAFAVSRGRAGLACAVVVGAASLVLDLAVPTGTRVLFSERVMYLPVAAACLLFGLGVCAVRQHCRGHEGRERVSSVIIVAVSIAAVISSGAGLSGRLPQWSSELNVVTDAVRVCPDSVTAHERMAIIALGSGDRAAAEFHVTRVNDIDPSYCAIQILQAEMALQSTRTEVLDGDDEVLERAKRHLRIALRCSPVARERAIAGLTMLWSRHLQDPAVPAPDRSDPEFFRERGELLELMQEADLASISWREVGVLAINAGDPAGAIRPLNHALTISPMRCEVHYWKGRALSKLKNTTGAIDSFWSALNCAVTVTRDDPGSFTSAIGSGSLSSAASSGSAQAAASSFLASTGSSAEPQPTKPPAILLPVISAGRRSGGRVLAADMALSAGVAATNDLIGMYLDEIGNLNDEVERAHVMQKMGDACWSLRAVALRHAEVTKGSPLEAGSRQLLASIELDRTAIGQWQQAGRSYLTAGRGVAAARAFAKVVGTPEGLWQCEVHLWYARAILRYLEDIDKELRRVHALRDLDSTAMPIGAPGTTTGRLSRRAKKRQAAARRMEAKAAKHDAELSTVTTDSSSELLADGTVIPKASPTVAMEADVRDALRSDTDSLTAMAAEALRPPGEGETDETLRMYTAIRHLKRSLSCPQTASDARDALSKLSQWEHYA